MSKYLLLLFTVTAFMQSQPLTFVECTLGSQTVTASDTCSIYFPTGYVTAFAGIRNLSTSTEVSVSADANSGSTADPGVPWSTSAMASDTEYYSTAGPVRPGYIDLNIGGFGGFPYVSVADFSSSGGYMSGIYRFELGIPFEADLYVSRGFGGGPATGGDSGGGYDFTLYEANGTTPVPFIYVNVPEPAATSFLLAGLGLVAFLRCRKQIGVL